jgi:uncharacterized protein YgiB involved in biofilm formation
MRKRKASLSITLVLIGAAGLAGCDEAPQDGAQYASRDVYASLEDCRKDWGRPEQCDPVPGSASGGGSTGVRYYGPWYGDSSPRSGPRPGSRAVDSVHVSRGGFGSSSAYHSSGG